MDEPPPAPARGEADVIEDLARACHESWRADRLREGWRLGRRKDEDRTHPGLIPYERLDEAVKEGNRQAARTMLDRARALGLISGAASLPPSLPAPAAAPTPGEAMLARIEAARGRLADLRACWDGGAAACWRDTPEPGRALAEALCRLGEPMFAYDVTDALLLAFPHDRRLRQLQAWALAQAGSPTAAEAVLQGLRAEGAEDVETLGFLARIRKDAARLASTAETRDLHLREAAELYRAGFTRTRSPYLGINAATMTLLCGDEAGAQRLADETRAACEAEGPPADAVAETWRLATLAEAALLRREPRAEEYYREFARRVAGERGALATARRQAAEILEHQGRSALLAQWLPLSPVVLFAGHRVDAPDEPNPRLAPADVPGVKALIAAQLEHWNARIGYASAAGGSDILFLEAMLERGGEIHIVLPFALESFRAIAFRETGRAEWLARFERVCAQAASLTLASHQVYGGGTTPFAFGSAMRHGLARIKARTLATDLRALAFWDGQPANYVGGTGATVQAWQAAGETVTVIAPPRQAPTRTPLPAPATEEQQVMAMLFADIVGYSKLAESDIPLFVEHFMRGIAGVVERFQPVPLHRNTWGDAFYLVFESARAAGRFALAMQRFGQRAGGWRALGLTRELAFRVGLHAGPVFPFIDPVIDRLAFSGSNVNRAARIEPITTEGQIFVSEQFAALAASEGATEFACDYVGLRELPKQAGELRLYLLRACDEN